MSKAEAIEMQKVLFEFTIDFMKNLKLMTQERKAVQQTMIQFMLEDRFYLKYGIEGHHMDEAMERLQVEEDPLYQNMVKDYMQDIQALSASQ
mmetsp:Transcript_13306/g.22599  ORF Transcript_13306/g.22599 Transcript_13306/m.22599 type:complete len:92 (-) Transcript_13306:50-325(-)